MSDILQTVTNNLGMKETASAASSLTVAAEGTIATGKQEGFRAPKAAVDNNTLLKQTFSLLGAVASIAVTEPLFGAKIPVYDGTLGDTLLNPIDRNGYSEVKSSEDKKNQFSRFHNATRNLTNALISVVNVPLYIATRSSLPKFEVDYKPIDFFLKKETQQKIAKSFEPLTKPINTFVAWAKETTVAKAIDKAHQGWANVLRSKAVYHTLNIGAGVLALGALGPVGWGIVGAVATADIARGSARVNRIQVKQDQLAHLHSLNESKKQIDILEKAHAQDFVNNLKKEFSSLSNSSTSKTNTVNKKDELDQAASKATVATIFKEGISLGVSATNAAVNHIGLAIDGFMAIVAWTANTKEKLSEQESKNAVKEYTNKLEKETGYTLNPTQSRQYDLAKTAYDHAVYAKALETAKNKPGYSVQEYIEEAKTVLSKDPKFQELFHQDKMEKPSILTSARNAASCLGSYLHPFKEPVSYEKVHEEHVNKLANSNNISTPTPNPQAGGRAHNLEKALERKSEGVAATNTPRMSEQMIMQRHSKANAQQL